MTYDDIVNMVLIFVALTFVLTVLFAAFTGENNP